ncbi:retrovirus-related pol polyprotein from transposon TNT 1-94 [Tanacetum coccineum]
MENVKKSKKLGSKERLASRRPRKPRTCLRWLPTRRILDHSGKIIESSDTESYRDLFMVRRLGLLQTYDRESEVVHQLHFEGKSKKTPHKTKLVPNSRNRLRLLYIDLCGPMRIESINGKRSKDEAQKEIIKFLKQIQVLLHAPVIIVRIDNEIELTNQELKAYFKDVGISHQTSSFITPSKIGLLNEEIRR